MDSVFEDRMNNWRRTVLWSGRRTNRCAWWADLHLGLQQRKGQNADEAPRSICYTDYQDGWRVEQAWRTLTDLHEKMLLKYWFVFQYSEHQIKRKLLLRHSGIKILLAQAQISLQKKLDRLSRSALGN
jgi:hypothetical protein